VLTELRDALSDARRGQSRQLQHLFWHSADCGAVRENGAIIMS
jgi:hypothetical protein